MNWLFDPWVIHIKISLTACWFPRVCSNHNKNKMCSDSFFFLERERRKRNCPRSLPFVSFVQIHIWWCICPFFSSLMMKMSILNARLFCVKTIFTPHSLVGCYWKTYHLHPNDRRYNSSQGHPVKRTNRNTLNVCSFYQHLLSWHQHWHDAQGYN
jgi:hypothetical protein